LLPQKLFNIELFCKKVVVSRPANPYDNASCESFMKTLKREEIYAQRAGRGR
jgi:hypothetical protein